MGKGAKKRKTLNEKASTVYNGSAEVAFAEV
jgi:hypothetical protein